MPLSRRFFLFSGFAALAAATTNQFKAAAKALTPAEATTAATAAGASSAARASAAAYGAYGANVRAQVFEVIVRQGAAGAPWREICAGPMKVNNITEEEVVAEIARRKAIEAEHANHSAPWDIASCAACRATRWKIATDAHDQHNEFTTECTHCANAERQRLQTAIERLGRSI